MQRKLNRWKCKLQAETGAVIETTLEAYWDPNKIGLELVGATACAEAFMQHDKQLRFQPIEITLAA